MNTGPLEPMAEPGLVLIIDDNPGNRLLLTSQLESVGHKVVQAENGREGLRLARECRPDLVLLDVMMPDMNGFNVCRRLKSEPATAVIPVVIVTTLREVAHRVQGIEAGADEFLSRPHNREELLVRARALIQLKRARARLEEERNRLQLLYTISRAITAQLDLETMMAQIIGQTQMAVAATRGHIILLNEVGEVTRSIGIRAGRPVKIGKAISREVMVSGLAAWLVREKRGDIIEDTQHDNRWIDLPDEEGEARSVIGVPLSRTDRIVGVLILSHPEPGYFRPEHLSLLATIGGQLSAAIENAYLFAEVSDQRRKLEAILAQSTDAIIVTDDSWQITLLNQAAERLFGLPATHFIGHSLRQIQRLEVLLSLFTAAGSQPVTREIQIHTGRYLHTSVTPILGVGYVAVMQDITEHKRVEALRLEQERRETERVKATLARYIGPALVEHVLSAEPGILKRQERRQAVVMFADLRGFTRLVVSVVPNVAIMLLNEFFTHMTQISYRFEGTIFDLAGDELMVGFNVPLEQPDAPYRAVLTAVAMQRRFQQLRQQWFRRLKTELGLGIGIAQGDVVVGNVGAETRMNYAMVGEAVNTAHRLVELAGDGHTVISEPVYEAVHSRAPRFLELVPFEAIGPVALRGKARPEVLYRATISRPGAEEQGSVIGEGAAHEI